jgi:archaellum biogenesis ATPase FlaH
MARKNITSSIRKGFRYQDLWALRLCAEWLLNPNSHTKLALETAPKAVGSASFHLEDIVLTNLNNTYSLFQIKHTQKPSSNKWTWKKLLSLGKPSKGKKRSLFQKWFNSYSNSKISKNINQASLITNGIPDLELKKYLDFKTGIIDIGKIDAGQPKLYTVLLAQAGNDSEKLRLFFNNFRFFFGRKGIKELNQEIESIFYKELKATEAGLNKLRIKITEECEREHPSPLTFQKIKSICEFDDPRPLNEEFIIPEDFELFDKNFHKEIISDLKSSTGGVKILYGNPGSGKSTYLSKLYKDLKKQKITVFKHHYFISADDPNYKERLQSERVIEAIKAELKQNFDELGNLAKQNSAKIQLREFLKGLGETYKNKNEPFVLIVDGLDHAVRHSSKEELTKFLEELSYSVSNFWLVLGTQESALSLLPKSIKDKCPDQAIKQIIGLSKNSVSKIVRRNILGLNVGDNQEQINDLITGLFSLTKGNPLHLHYTLIQLKNKFKDSLVTNYSLNYLKPYEQNIEVYYSNLWSGLSPIAKTFSLVICSVNFFFKKQYFFDLAGDLTRVPSDVSKGFDDVVHLLSVKNEKISIYHENFKIFVLGRTEYIEQNSAIKKRIKNWLKKSNYEDLKWAELKKIEFELGNPKPILTIDIDWIINSLVSPRNENQILSQLNLAAKAAMQCKDFPALARITLQRMYFENNTKYSGDEHDELWTECFSQLKSDVDEFNLEELSSEQLLSVAKKFKKIGKINEVYRGAFEIIRERCSSIRIGDKNGIGGTSKPDIVEHLIRVYSLDNNHDPEYVHKIITGVLRSSNWSEEFFGIYVSSLLETDQYSKIESLLALPLVTGERNQILDLCAEHDFLFSEKRFLEIIKSQLGKNPSCYCLFYFALNRQSLPFLPKLPMYSKFPLSVHEYIPENQEGDYKLFFDSFLLGFIYQAVGKTELIKEWIDKSEKRWPVEIAAVLLNSAVQFSSNYRQSKKMNFKSLITALNEIPQLNFPEDRELIGLQRSLHIAVKKIFKLIYVLNKNKNQKFIFSKDDVKELKKGSYYNFNNFVEDIWSIPRPCLSVSAIECFLPSESYKDLLSYESMSGRVGNYLKLSRIMKTHSMEKEAHLYLKLAGQNFMGHGYHKDTIVFDILRCIRDCKKIGKKKKVEDWVFKTLPIVENYSDFTDGDETRHLPNELANTLQEINPKLLCKYYSHIANKEELYRAELIFPKILRTFSYRNEFEKAIAESAIDKDSFETLEEISKTNVDAKAVFDSITNYFGSIKHPEDRDSGNSPISPEVEIDYSTIEPKDFKKKYEEVDGWNRSKFLVSWYKCWSSKVRDKKEIYHVLLSVVEDHETDSFNGGLYDLLYPITYEYDTELSYRFLCQAQILNHGWNFYWDIKEKTIARWAFLKKNFPGRHLEFFEKTTLNNDKWLGKEEGYFFPIPAGIEFLIFFGENDIAENTTDVIVGFCKTLTADIEFTVSEWFNSKSHDLLDLLFQRLLWPSPLVKERVANSIYKLLLNPIQGKQVLKRLLIWLENQPLISVKTIRQRSRSEI